MKTSMFFLLPLLAILIAFTTAAQSESDWFPSPENMTFRLDYDCDGEPDALVGNFMNHGVNHFIDSENQPKWSKLKGHGEFKSVATEEVFKVIATTKTHGISQRFREQRFNLIGNMGSRMHLTQHFTWIKNPHGSGYIRVVTYYEIKCL